MDEDKNKLATQQPNKLPTIKELVDLAETDQAYADNNLAVLLNQPPPKGWVKFHPIAKVKNEKGEEVPLPYLPIERVEYLLTRIFTIWHREIKSVMVIANSVQVTVRLHVRNPLTMEMEWNDGVGAVAIQTDKGKGAMDWNFAKANGVQLAVPAAAAYATKNAAEQWGNLFGKDLARREQVNYTDILVKEEQITAESLKELYERKKEMVKPEDQIRIEEIIRDKETKQYRNVAKKLQAL